MKIVYIAGPYTAPTNWEIQQNINAAMAAGRFVAEMGAMPLIIGIQTPQFWYDGTMELLRRSDAILLIQGWKNSKGAVLERDEAIRLRMPIFYWGNEPDEIDYLNAMKLWIKGVLAFPGKLNV